MKIRHWEILSGLWSPRDGKYSFVTVGQYDTAREGQAALDERLAEMEPDALISPHPRRLTYNGAPLALVQIDNLVVCRVGRDGAPDWALEDGGEAVHRQTADDEPGLTS